jgi:hypothetical protein
MAFSVPAQCVKRSPVIKRGGIILLYVQMQRKQTSRKSGQQISVLMGEKLILRSQQILTY